MSNKIKMQNLSVGDIIKYKFIFSDLKYLYDWGLVCSINKNCRSIYGSTLNVYWFIYTYSDKTEGQSYESNFYYKEYNKEINIIGNLKNKNNANIYKTLFFLRE